MKIFATADIHGNRQIMDKLKILSSKVDLIVICGDIGGNDYHGITFSQLSVLQAKDADYLCQIINDIDAECRFILGNDDWFEFGSPYHLISPEKIRENLLIPFEFVSCTPFKTNREANENKLTYELLKISADNNSIIVAHTPPFNAGDTLCNGRHCGSKAIRTWIEKEEPKIWLCGHIHEDNSACMIRKTLVLNCSCMSENNILTGWIVDTETLEYEKIEI